MVFSPPILRIDEPLFVGKIWELDSQDSDSLTYHFRFEVTAFGDVVVPAGTFQAFTIRQSVEYPEGGGAEKVRRPLPGILGSTEITQQVLDQSYVDGIGLIQIVLGPRTDGLISRRTVSVEPSTWSRIRMLYR